MFLLLLLLLASSAISCAPTTITALPVPPPPSRKTMKAFKSEQEMRRYFRELAEKQKRKGRGYEADAAVANSALGPATGPTGLFTIYDEESITNTQHAGVDEGGIVKVHGKHLVILRRGRLFTVAIDDSSLTPVSTVDAFAPGIEPQHAWYDEMLIAENTVVVIGYSYERGGTEVGFFNIDAQGQLSYRSTYHLRSNDYYSSRNYASRLIGNKLIFYTPLHYYPNDEDLFRSFPAVRKWHKEAKPEEFRRIVDATRVYRPEWELNVEYGSALHTVTTCDLSNGGFDCRATVVLGPPGRVFYVSPDSVYVWATSWGTWGNTRSAGLLFRMPLDGSGPGALRVSGSPVDQFSFLQSEDYHLNVLVRSQAKGDAMWAAEASAGDVALMRIGLSSFSDGSETVPSQSYWRLPQPSGHSFQNRFVGNYLIYGTGNSSWPPTFDKSKRVYLVEWARSRLHRLEIPHGVERIEQLGNGAVVVGSDGTDLHFTSLRLGAEPEIASRYTRPRAAQGETRSHGFFYKADSADTGMLGLPITAPARTGTRHLFDTSAAILFLRSESLQFKEIGELGAQSEKAVDDRCRASCVDWYGNARPLFLRGRVFALLGYELVEGKVDDGRISELRRINYAPR